MFLCSAVRAEFYYESEFQLEVGTPIKPISPNPAREGIYTPSIEMPQGLSINMKTGVISGTPLAVGPIILAINYESTDGTVKDATSISGYSIFNHFLLNNSI